MGGIIFGLVGWYLLIKGFQWFWDAATHDDHNPGGMRRPTYEPGVCLACGDTGFYLVPAQHAGSSAPTPSRWVRCTCPAGQARF